MKLHLNKLLALLAPFFAAVLGAQTIPATLNYQGRLTDNTPQQAPVNATVSMRFALHDAASGGTAVWTEPASGGTPVSVTDGIFSVQLGAILPIPAATFTGGADRWLEIILNPGAGNEEILAPRQKLSAVAYANLSADSASLGGVAATGYQKLVTPDTCPAGQYLMQIRATGAAQCAPDQGVTAVVPTQGISGSIVGTTLNLSTDVTVQRRNVAPVCLSGQYLQSIAANGTPTCVSDVGASVPLTLSGTPPTPTIWGTHTGGNSGVRGDSAGSHGIYGVTSSPGAGYAGVYGSQSQYGVNGALGTSALVGATPTGVGAYGSASGGYGVYGSSATGRGVYGWGVGASGVNYGVFGESASTAGFAVYGSNSSSGNYGRLGGGSEGVYGGTTASAGVRGESSGAGTGVIGYSNSNTGIGVSGGTLGGGTGVSGSASNGYGVKGSATGGNGVRGEASNGIGVQGVSTTGIALRGDTGSGTAILGYSNSNSGTGVSGGTLGGGTGVSGSASGGIGVKGTSSSGIAVSGSTGGTGLGAPGVYGETTSASGFTYGVLGSADSTSGRGVYGHATAVTGATNGVVGEVESDAGAGVRAIGSSTDNGYALQIENGRVRAYGAGINTHTFAFIHETSGGNSSGDTTCINNAMINNHPEAIVTITPVRMTTGLVYNFPWTLYYSDSSVFPSSWTWNKWCIMRQDTAPDGIPTGHRWHVLVFFP